MNYIKDRLKEPSTWRGIVLFLTGVLGVHLGADAQDAIVSIGITAAGLLGSLLPDQK